MVIASNLEITFYWSVYYAADIYSKNLLFGSILDTHYTHTLTSRVSQYQKKHSPTLTYPDHQPSFISFLHLFRSIASSLFTLCAWQFLHNFSAGPLSTSRSETLHFILHTFLHPIIVFFFCNTCPYLCNLFCCSTEIMSSNPSLSLNSTWNSIYTSTHGSGRRYTILLVKFLSLFFSFFFFRQRISEMALPTGNLSGSDGRI